MKHLNNLESLLQQKLDEGHSKIVLGVYNWMLNRHSDINCHCDYCSKLPAYVRLQVLKHKSKKRLYSDYEPYYAVNDIATDKENYFMLKYKVQRYKGQMLELKKKL